MTKLGSVMPNFFKNEPFLASFSLFLIYISKIESSTPDSPIVCEQLLLRTVKSPGLRVIGGDSCSKGCGFELKHCIPMDIF